MPYDAQGNYTAVTQPNPDGFYPGEYIPTPNTGTGVLTAAKASALIAKEIG